jgi:hypothetical protein
MINSTSNYGNIESVVNDIFLQKKHFYNDIELIWKKIEWSDLNKAFSLGNLVIESPFGSDQFILNSVRSSISEIDKELHENGKLNKNQKIIFKIVKPLVERIPLLIEVL